VVILDGADLHREELEPELVGRLLAGLPLRDRAGCLRVPQDGDAREPGQDFLEKLQALAGQDCRDVGDARDVAARARQALD
jgi:hypothetical protein